MFENIMQINGKYWRWPGFTVSVNYNTLNVWSVTFRGVHFAKTCHFLYHPMQRSQSEDFVCSFVTNRFSTFLVC